MHMGLGHYYLTLARLEAEKKATQDAAAKSSADDLALPEDQQAEQSGPVPVQYASFSDYCASVYERVRTMSLLQKSFAFAALGGVMGVTAAMGGSMAIGSSLFTVGYVAALTSAIPRARDAVTQAAAFSVSFFAATACVAMLSSDVPADEDSALRDVRPVAMTSALRI